MQVEALPLIVFIPQGQHSEQDSPHSLCCLQEVFDRCKASPPITRNQPPVAGGPEPCLSPSSAASMCLGDALWHTLAVVAALFLLLFSSQCV